MQIRTLIAGAIFGGAVLLSPGIAGADTTCYTGCTTPTTGVVAQVTPPAPAAAAPVAPASGLAFTGADIEEMAILGLAAIGGGALLIRRRKTA